MSAESTSLVGGSFAFGGSKTIFSALVMRYVSEKSTLNMKMANTIIKITESKENKSIHRLDVSGSTGPGGTAAPPASYGSARPMTSRKADYTPGWNLL